MQDIACCFTGHRTMPAERMEELQQRLRAGILYLRDNMGITTFYAGGALGFDSLAAEAVTARREELKDIRALVQVQDDMDRDHGAVVEPAAWLFEKQ